MKENKRDRILQTARRLFLLYGYSGVSIRTIASQAKLTTGAVYFHFTNKKDIYKTICFEAIDILSEKFKNGINSRVKTEQKLISTFDSYIEFFYNHRDYYRLLMEYKAAYGAENDERNEVVQKLKDLLDILLKTIEIGIEEKVYRGVDPVRLSLFLAVVAEGMLQYKNLGIFDTLEISDRSFRDFMADIIGNGILKK
jgi:AcrR family transcriptional regulator